RARRDVRRARSVVRSGQGRATLTLSARVPRQVRPAPYVKKGAGTAAPVSVTLTLTGLIRSRGPWGTIQMGMGLAPPSLSTTTRAPGLTVVVRRAVTVIGAPTVDTTVNWPVSVALMPPLGPRSRADRPADPHGTGTGTAPAPRRAPPEATSAGI